MLRKTTPTKTKYKDLFPSAEAWLRKISADMLPRGRLSPPVPSSCEDEEVQEGVIGPWPMGNNEQKKRQEIPDSSSPTSYQIVAH
jgi:hypothetical protein